MEACIHAHHSITTLRSKRVQRRTTVVAAAVPSAPSNRGGTASTSSSGQSIVMRPLGRQPLNGSGVNGTSSTVMVLPPANGNGNSSNGNGKVTLQVPVNGNGNGNGRTLMRVTRPVRDYMPAVRAAALEASSAMASARSSAPSPSASGPAASTLPQVVFRDFPSDVDFKWAQDRYSSTQRTIDTWSFFAVFRARLWLLDQKWSYAGGYTEAKKGDRARGLARYLLNSILQLGPTFIKVGQLSSTRSDLFPAEFIEELSELQDRVPAFGSAKAIAIIEKELGAPISKLFYSFDERPIAAASLGQVHVARLHSGEEVVVKVQRPGLRQLFDIDLNNLRLLAEALDKGDDTRDFKGIYQECATVLYDEIDYIKEGRNVDRFRRNFKDTPFVRAPVVYWEYSSPRVLTLEYLPGIKISDQQRLLAAGLDPIVIAQRATESYLIQILRHGFFHADPHPGNVAVDAAGNLLYYDMGMVGEIQGNVRERLLEVFYGIYRKDSGQVVRALVDLGVITPSGDLLSVRRSINYFIENIQRQTERKETIQAIGADLFAIALDQPFRFPATFTFVLRAFSTLEGVGKSLDPEYQFSSVAAPYAQELLQLQDAAGSAQGFVMEQLQQQATEMGQAAAAMPSRIARIDATLAQLEAGDLKLRVRVLEGERAARRAGVLQMCTMNAIGAVGFMDIGSNLALANHQGPATLSMALSCVFGVLLLRGFQRVKKLDAFEKDLRR